MKIKVNLNIIYVMFAMLAFFAPPSLQFVSWGNVIDEFLWVIRVIISFFYIFKVFINYRIEKMDILVILFLSSQILSAQQTGTLYIGYLSGQLTALGLYAFLKYNLLTQSEVVIKGSFSLFVIFILFQIFTQLRFPTGFDILHPYGDNREYFLGRKNAMTPYLVFALGYFYLITNKMSRKITYSEILFLILCCIISLLSSSSTTILCFVLFIFFRFWGLKDVVSNAYLKITLISYAVFSFLILSAQSSFFTFVTGLFGKDVTFSGRLNIWQQAIAFFNQNPVFGNGLNLNFTPWTNGVVVNTAHNYLLDLLARFGIITGIIFIIVLISFILGKNRIKSKVLFTILICYLYYILMESSSTNFYLSIIACLYYLGIQEGKFKNEKNI
ncbi:O-antigen ligase family protein [Streptococcus parasuis]|uniref:O-antigen ligase family protein n=1 Tax=Streptococcus parasuis TaxID=1501662 RepID=UPI0028AC1EB4|nr:O-antigen ligase family protein [Streptococcus parasuis]